MTNLMVMLVMTMLLMVGRSTLAEEPAWTVSSEWISCEAQGLNSHEFDIPDTEDDARAIAEMKVYSQYYWSDPIISEYCQKIQASERRDLEAMWERTWRKN